MKNYFPALLFPVLLLGFVPVPSTVHASVPNGATVCFAFHNNIRFGQQDSGLSVDVGNIQHFLVTQGYFDAANLGTGHFGPLTLSAVKKFQAAHDVPATGFVGPLTRTAINAAQPNCNMQPVALYSLSPNTGTTGIQVSVRGFGFSESNTVLIDGMVAARNVPISSSIAIACTTDPSCHGGINQTIIFTLPGSVSPDCPTGSMCPLYMRELTPGKVTITVRNSTAVSNGLPFTITK